MKQTYNVFFLCSSTSFWSDLASVVIPAGEYSWFQTTGMVEWGQKLKPKKIPRASNKN